MTVSDTSSTTSTSESWKPSSSSDDVLDKVDSTPEYPPTSKVVVIMISVCLTMFLVALDRLIIGTAIPTITNEFNSLDDVGWYGSSYLLTSCAFALLMGKIYTFYSPKWIFIVCIVIFEIGSAVSGAAPTSTALIIGRAVAGLGNAGIFQGAIIIVFSILPLHKRPMIMGFMGMVFGVASAVGPLLGGVFTDELSWRWCFYINLPIGAVVLVILIFVLKVPHMTLPSKNEKKEGSSKLETYKARFAQLDPLGTFFFFPGVICLLLALQWGGITYAWSNFRPILLLVLFIVLIFAFIVTQYSKGVNATVPSHIIKNRSILAGIWFTFTNGGSMMTLVYFIPIYFQAIKSASAVKSGIMNLPLVLSLVVGSILAGILTKKIGYYTPALIFSAIVTPIGAGLITTFTPSTSHAAWIGYQIIFGFGTGVGMQQPSVAAQTVLKRKDVPTGASLMFFAQTLGGAIVLSIANNLFNSRLATGLLTVPGIDAVKIGAIGATELRHYVGPNALDAVLVVYNAALREAFYVSVVLSSLSIIGALAMEWNSVKKDAPHPDTTRDQEKPVTSKSEV